jgi:hypothetical protein
MNKIELKKAYKQSHTPMGILQIKNNINGKEFIVSSANLPGTINKYQFSLKYKVCVVKELQQDWDMYGEENFSFNVIDNLEPKEDPAYNYKEDLKTLQDLWIDKIQPFGEKGYNKQEAKQ